MAKTVTRQLSVRLKPSSVTEAENASRKRRSAMERFSVPTAKTRRTATSVSRGDVQPTRSHADLASVCRSMSSATQSFRAEMAQMSRHISADPTLSSQIHSKDPRALRRREEIDIVRSSAATVDAEAQQSSARAETAAAMEATSKAVQCVVSIR
jgi:hypothetical protein